MQPYTGLTQLGIKGFQRLFFEVDNRNVGRDNLPTRGWNLDETLTLSSSSGSRPTGAGEYRIRRGKIIAKRGYDNAFKTPGQTHTRTRLAERKNFILAKQVLGGAQPDRLITRPK